MLEGSRRKDPSWKVRENLVRPASPLPAPGGAFTAGGGVVEREDLRGRTGARPALARQDHAAEAVADERADEDVGREVPAEGDAGHADKRGGAVGRPGDPAVILPVHPGEDARRGERAGGVPGRERSGLLPRVRVIL